METPLFDHDARPGSVEQAVLSMARRSKLVLKQVVREQWFASATDDSPADRLLCRLVDEGRLIRVEGRLAFARSAYLLPGHTLRADADLAKVWFCYLSGMRGYLTTWEETKELYEREQLTPPFHNLSFALVDKEGGPVLLRLYYCLAEKKNAAIQLRTAVGKSARSFEHWCAEGSYGVAVLVNTEPKKREVAKLLKASFGGAPPLEEQARFIVEVVPTAERFGQAVRRREEDRRA